MPADLIFTVDVDYTDRTRQPSGAFNVWTRTVSVLASDDADAQLAAAQLVGALRDDALDGMVLATRVTDVVV